MTDKVKAIELLEPMRELFAEQIRKTLAGTPGHEAFQCADALCRVWLEELRGLLVDGGAVRAIDHDAIAADWSAGRSVEEIISRHGCSRATAYNHHPSKRRRAACG